MQSLASLMSVKPSDVGNLDDFAESDEDEANGHGAPRGPQSGGLAVIYGLRLPGPKMDVAFLCPKYWLLWGRAGLYMPSDRCLRTAQQLRLPQCAPGPVGVLVLSRILSNGSLVSPRVPGHFISRWTDAPLVPTKPENLGHRKCGLLPQPLPNLPSSILVSLPSPS